MTRIDPSVLEKLRNEGYLPVAEAAERVKRDRSAVYRKWTEGHIAGKKVFDLVFIHWGALLRHLGPDTCKALGYEYPAT